MSAQKMKVPTEFIAIDKMSRVFKKMRKNAGTFVTRTQSKLAKLERTWRSVGDRAAKTGRSALLFATAIIAPMGLMINEAVKFEQAMSNVSTLLDASAEEMEKMGEEVLSLAEKMPVPISELTESLYDIRSAGIGAADAMNVLEAAGKLSVSGLATTKEATDVLTSSINAFASQGLSANEIANILFKSVKYGKTNIAELSQQFGAVAPMIESAGIKLEEYAAATAALTTSGIKAPKVQTMLKAAISNLQKPTEEMKEMFEQLEVTTHTELIEKFGGLVPAFAAIQEEADRTGMNMAKLFGSTEGLNAVIGLLGANNEAYVDTLADMTSGTDALNEAFQKQLGTGKSQMQLFKNQIQSLSIQLGQVLLPILIDLMKAITPSIKQFGKWAKENKALLGTIFKIATAVAGVAVAVSGVSFAVAGFAKAGVAAFKTVGFALKAFSVMASMNPFVLMIAGAIALGAALYSVFTRTKELSIAQQTYNDVKQRVIDNTADELVSMKLLFAELRRVETGSEEYKNTLVEIDKLQPGIVDKYNLQAGALKDMAAAERELARAIMERATADAIAAQIRETMGEIIKLQMEGPQEYSFLNAEQERNLHQKKMMGMQQQVNLLTNAQVQMEQGGFESLLNGQLPVVNTDVTKEEVNNTTTNKETIDVNVNLSGAPDGTTMGVTKSAGLSMPSLSTTN